MGEKKENKTKKTVSEVKKPNYFFKIKIKGKNNYLTGSKHFFSEEELEAITKKLEQLETSTKTEDAKKNKVRITVTSKETGKSRSVTVIRQTNEQKKEIEKLKRNVQLKIIPSELKKRKYRVVVDNIATPTWDKKSLSITSTRPLEKVHDEIQRIILELVKENDYDDIVFCDDDRKSKSHRIRIYESGSTEKYKNMKCRSFSITFPNRSSSEIISLLKDRVSTRC